MVSCLLPSATFVGACHGFIFLSFLNKTFVSTSHGFKFFVFLLTPTCLSSTGASCVTAFAVEDWKLEMFEVFVLESEN